MLLFLKSLQKNNLSALQEGCLIMKNILTNKTKQAILLFCISILLVLFVFASFIICNINSSKCYIGNYDEYICYNGEIYYKICDENRDLFSSEFYNSYQNYAIVNGTDLDERAIDIRGINTSARFLTDRVRVVYNNSDHDEIVFLTLEHFPESAIEYAKSDK